jgi:hypothetical protein
VELVRVNKAEMVCIKLKSEFVDMAKQAGLTQKMHAYNKSLGFGDCSFSVGNLKTDKKQLLFLIGNMVNATDEERSQLLAGY